MSVLYLRSIYNLFSQLHLLLLRSEGIMGVWLTLLLCFQTQIQELGFMSYNCSCMASDMSKIFKVYWDLATPDSKIPDPWPHKYRTNISAGW